MITLPVIAISCFLTLEQYMAVEVHNLNCKEANLVECFQFGKPGDVHHIPGEKGLDMFLNDLRFRYEITCTDK